MDSAELGALATSLIDALEVGDVAAARQCYAPGAWLWTNLSQQRVDASAAAAILPSLVKRMPDRRYSNRKISLFDDGFVHRHRVTGTRSDGATVAMEACLIVHVDRGKVASMEEYVDSSQMQAIFSSP